MKHVSVTYIIRTIKSRRMRWAGHVTHMGEMRSANNVLVGRGHTEDLGVDGRIILEWIFGK
jgi:hypothetical protein